MFGIIDCNNFYASCERAFNPNLEGKPIVVLSNNDGCVIARSNEAKALGIEMGTPAFQIATYAQSQGLIAFSSNYTLYGDISERVVAAIASMVERYEVYSIDECFVDLSGYEKITADVYEYAWMIQQRIRRWTGIPVSIGVAPTKTLAKVANRRAKKNPLLGGIVVLKHESEIRRALDGFDIGDLWGIGRKYVNKLKALGCEDALHLSQQREEWVRKIMTVQGVRLLKELQGFSCIELELVPDRKKAICCAKSFGEYTDNRETVSEALANYAATCAKKLRKEGSIANMLTVFITTNYYSLVDAQYSATKTIHLDKATNYTPDMIHQALKALGLIWKDGFKFKKVGCIVSGLQPEEFRQAQLFTDIDWEKEQAAMKALDTVNGWYGRDKVKVAAQGYKRDWKMIQERLSPCYTTRWKDLLTVKCK